MSRTPSGGAPHEQVAEKAADERMLPLLGVTILAGVLAGWLRGWSLATIGTKKLRAAWLVPIALAAQVYMVRRIGLEVPWWVLPLHLASNTLLIVTVLANWRLAGMRLIGAGLLMNSLAIFSNGGLMPQAPETLHVRHAGQAIAIGQHPPRTKDVVLPREHTRFWWLSDVLATPPGFPVQTVMSPGDIVLVIGVGWAVRGLMQPPRLARLARPPRRMPPLQPRPRRLGWRTSSGHAQAHPTQ